MKPFDRQSLDDQTRLVSRYVAGDLSRSERAEFETWLVASPDLASEVEMERRLRRGIASAARRGWLKRGATQGSDHARRWRVAIAASLVISLTTLGLSLVLPNHDADSSATVRAAQHKTPSALTREVRLGSVRGRGAAPDLLLALNDAPGELVVEPDVVVLTCEDGSMELECAGGAAPQTPQYPEYEMDLVNRRSSALTWRSARQLPVAGAPLSFTLHDPARLEAGDYDLIVRGHAPDHEEVVARFWLHVAAQ